MSLIKNTVFLKRLIIIFAVIFFLFSFLKFTVWSIYPDLNKYCLEAVSENTTKVKILVWLGADVNYPNHGSGTLLHWAAATGNIDLMRFLLHNGADLNSIAKFGVTPLYEAKIYKQVEAEKFLIANGANPDTSRIHAP